MANEKKRPVNTMDVTLNVEKHVLTIDFPTINKQLCLIAADLATEIRTYAMMHGLKQKLVDAAAIKRNEETGQPASAEDKFQAVEKVLNRLRSGHWNKPADEASEVGGGLLFRALKRLYPTATEDKLRKMLAEKSKAEQAAMRKHPKIAPIIEELKAEDAAKNADEGSEADDLLADFEAGLEGDGEA